MVYMGWGIGNDEIEWMNQVLAQYPERKAILNFHEYLLASGGMPSSHSACVCACAASTGMLYGFTNPLFAIAAVLAVVVMYDAANVRKATGEQAMIINYMMEHWEQAKPELFDRELKEMIGHSPLQVVVGGALGVAVGLVGSLPVIIM